MTKITIAIPVHNSEHCLRETLECALAQTFPAYEIIVVDDGSTDGTAALVQSFGDRVRYIRQENSGASAARNNAIQHATGDWIAFLDHDDLFQPDKLEKQRAVIEANPQLVVIYSAFTFLYVDGTTKELSVFPATKLWPALRYRTPILPSTSVVRRDALLRIEGFKSGPLVRRVEDWDLWFRLMQQYSAIAFHSIPESLVRYSVLPNSESKSFMPLAANALHLMDTLLLDGLTGLRRSLWRRRVQARIYYHLALSMRDANNPRDWEFMIKSMLLWPLAGKIVPVHRYRVFAHMLFTRLLSPRANFRYWWPRRQDIQSLRAE